MNTTTSPIRRVYSELALNDFGEIAALQTLATDILTSQQLLRSRVEDLLADRSSDLNRKELKMLAKAIREEFALTGADLTFD